MSGMSSKVLQIVRTATDEVTWQSTPVNHPSSLLRMETGANRNLDHGRFHTRIVDYIEPPKRPNDEAPEEAQ